jgi:ParB/RepB/Spo0J family partition protein
MFKGRLTMNDILSKLGETADQVMSGGGLPVSLPVDIIDSEIQDRKLFRKEHIDGMAGSIQVDGQLSPILVTPSPDDPSRYLIVFGECRWRAIKQLGDRPINATIRPDLQDPKDRKVVRLVENIQRDQLTFFEEAMGYQSLMKLLELDRPSLCIKVNKKNSQLKKHFSIIDYPTAVIELGSDSFLKTYRDVSRAKKAFLVDDNGFTFKAFSKHLKEGGATDTFTFPGEIIINDQSDGSEPTTLETASNEQDEESGTEEVSLAEAELEAQDATTEGVDKPVSKPTIKSVFGDVSPMTFLAIVCKAKRKKLDDFDLSDPEDVEKIKTFIETVKLEVE